MKIKTLKPSRNASGQGDGLIINGVSSLCRPELSGLSRHLPGINSQYSVNWLNSRSDTENSRVIRKLVFSGLRYQQ